MEWKKSTLNFKVKIKYWENHNKDLKALDMKYQV